MEEELTAKITERQIHTLKQVNAVLSFLAFGLFGADMSDEISLISELAGDKLSELCEQIEIGGGNEGESDGG